jgi:mycothiol system anti-sigma-R factor
MHNGEPLDCDMALQQLWDYLDQELTDERMAEVREHLMRCAECLPHVMFGERFLLAIRQTREERAMPPYLRARVETMLREERASGANPNSNRC